MVASRVDNSVTAAEAEIVVLALADRDGEPLIVDTEEALRLSRTLEEAVDTEECIAILEKDGPEVETPLSVIHRVG